MIKVAHFVDNLCKSPSNTEVKSPADVCNLIPHQLPNQIPSSIPTYGYTTMVCPHSSYTSSAPASCFAGSETVVMESGETRSISMISPGDRIMAASGDFSTSFATVLLVPHSQNKYRADFVHILLESGLGVKMTQTHLIPSTQDCGSKNVQNVRAIDLEVGSCVLTVEGQRRVIEMQIVSGTGLYTVITDKEYLVVNGIIASPYAFNHQIADVYYDAFRFMYHFFPQLFQPSHWLNTAYSSIADMLMSVAN